MPRMRTDVDVRCKYDPSSEESISQYVRALSNRFLRDLCLEKDLERYSNKKDKGAIGKTIEYGVFYIEPNNSPEPDFDIGIELKVTGLKHTKGRELVAKERISIGQINFDDILNGQSFDESLHNKLHKMLVVFYEYEKDIEIRNIRIDTAVIWEFKDDDLKVIMNDWNIIRDCIKQGRELSSRLTSYLEPMPKGKNAKDMTDCGGRKVKKRGFGLKRSYVNSIYTSTRNQKTTYLEGDHSKPFDTLILERFDRFAGKDISLIQIALNIDIGSSKQRLAILSRYMFCGKNPKHIDELEKAGIMMKTVRIGPDGRPNEPMTFPAFDYIEVAESTWDDSEFRETLDYKVLLMIFDDDRQGNVIFRKAALWLIPEEDLGTVRSEWEAVHYSIADDRYEFVTHQKDAEIVFVKPHGTKKNRSTKGPDGNDHPRMCFALTQDYIAKVVKNL